MLRTLLPVLTGAALISAASLPAMAADIADAQFDPPIYYDPPPVFGGWYLRGHIGMSNQRYRGLDYWRYAELAAAGLQLEWLDRGGFGSAPLFGGGVGYQLNQWLRGDITVEYRGKASYSALDRITEIAPPNNIVSLNRPTAQKSEWLVLANAYADMGTFYGFTPYAGVGIGTSRNTISQFVDTNILNGGGGYAGTASQWQLAWALHAGVGFDVTDRTTIDLGYSFTHLGNATTAQAFNLDPNQPTQDNDGFKFRGIHSHDLKLGVRYRFN